MADFYVRAPNEFYGYSSESSKTFIDGLNRYLQLKDININRWTTIFQAMMAGPAREALETTAAPGGELFTALANNNPIQAGIAVGANAAAIALAHRETYNKNCQWLINTYAGAQVQQELQEDIMRMRQHSNESPKDFHTRIRHAIRLVAVADTVILFLMQTIFIQGLHSDIRMHVETQGTQQLTTKLIRAQRYWNAYHGGERTLADEVPETVRNRFNPATLQPFNQPQ